MGEGEEEMGRVQGMEGKDRSCKGEGTGRREGDKNEGGSEEMKEGGDDEK